MSSATISVLTQKATVSIFANNPRFQELMNLMTVLWKLASNPYSHNFNKFFFKVELISYPDLLTLVFSRDKTSGYEIKVKQDEFIKEHDFNSLSIQTHRRTMSHFKFY